MGLPRLPHLLGIEGLSPETISGLLDLSENYIDQNRSIDKRRDMLAGRTVINLFFENSTRTRTSFEVAAKRLGSDVINMDVATSSVRKGETLLDTAMTLNAMRPDAIVVRHHESGAVNLLSQKVNCAVINAGDGQHEHPTQALLDALTIRRRRGSLQGLLVAICGDIMHSRVARSNAWGLTKLGAQVVFCGPPTMLPFTCRSNEACQFSRWPGVLTSSMTLPTLRALDWYSGDWLGNHLEETDHRRFPWMVWKGRLGKHVSFSSTYFHDQRRALDEPK